MSTCLFVTGILYLLPDPLLESDDKVIIKPMSRVHLLVKWNMHFMSFNVYGTAVTWARMGLIAPLVI